MVKGDGRSGDALAERVARLEESQAFSERGLEQLSAEMAEINRRLGEVAARLGRLEGKVRAAEEAKESGEGEAGGREE